MAPPSLRRDHLLVYVRPFADLLAEVVVAVDYRDEEYEVTAIVDEILHVRGRLRLVDLEPAEREEILRRHRHAGQT